MMELTRSPSIKLIQRNRALQAVCLMTLLITLVPFVIVGRSAYRRMANEGFSREPSRTGGNTKAAIWERPSERESSRSDDTTETDRATTSDTSDSTSSSDDAPESSTRSRRELDELLATLKRTRQRPSRAEWTTLSRVCRNRNRHEDCDKIFEYVRSTLIPLDFPRQYQPRQEWRQQALSGLAKRAGTDRRLSTTKTVEQIGDDSALMGPNFLIVSDGVTRDPDSDYMSLQLVEFLRAGLGRVDRKGKIEAQLRKLIAYAEFVVHSVQLPAAATLSVVYLTDKYIYVAVIGDSEVKIVREGQTIFRSELQRRGNVPGQINARFPNAASYAKIDRVGREKDDVVIMASDGLWDNVLESHVIATVNEASDSSMGALATRILAKAKSNKELPTKICAREGPDGAERCVGGRRDDITIVVARA